MLRAARVAFCLSFALVAGAETKDTLVVRGKEQVLRLYGSLGGRPVLVSSGDGGWNHLGPQLAEFLASQGYFVVGLDSKAYLSSFTNGTMVLKPEDVRTDYRAFAERARGGRAEKVLLVGVSEGAGLSVLAASEESLQPALAGVLALGLPDVNELGWRFSDSIIYLTHKVPNEPTFKAADYIPRMGVVPFAAIHSSHDEFVPLEEVRRLLGLPGGPRKLMILEAADHRFSDAQSRLQVAMREALDWIHGARP